MSLMEKEQQLSQLQEQLEQHQRRAACSWRMRSRSCRKKCIRI